jgi:hypothetical protein
MVLTLETMQIYKISLKKAIFIAFFNGFLREKLCL